MTKIQRDLERAYRSVYAAEGALEAAHRDLMALHQRLKGRGFRDSAVECLCTFSHLGNVEYRIYTEMQKRKPPSAARLEKLRGRGEAA